MGTTLKTLFLTSLIFGSAAITGCGSDDQKADWQIKYDAAEHRAQRGYDKMETKAKRIDAAAQRKANTDWAQDHSEKTNEPTRIEEGDEKDHLINVAYQSDLTRKGCNAHRHGQIAYVRESRASYTCDATPTSSDGAEMRGWVLRQENIEANEVQ